MHLHESHDIFQNLFYKMYNVLCIVMEACQPIYPEEWTAPSEKKNIGDFYVKLNFFFFTIDVYLQIDLNPSYYQTINIQI